MRYRVRCSRSIPTFALAFAFTLAAAAGAEPAGRDRSPEQGRVATVLESLRRWLGIGSEEPAAAAAPATRTTVPGSGTPTGGEANPTHDPNGGGGLPPGYDPDLGGD